MPAQTESGYRMPHTTIDKGTEKQPITGSILEHTKSGENHWKFMKGIVLDAWEGLSVTKENYCHVILCVASDSGEHTTIDKGTENQPIAGSILEQTKDGEKHWTALTKGIVLATWEGSSVKRENYYPAPLCAPSDFGFVKGEDAKLHFDYEGLVKDWKYIVQSIENGTLVFDVANLAEDWLKVLAKRVVIENGELRLQYADIVADWAYCADSIMNAELPSSSDRMIASPSSEEKAESIMHAELPISASPMPEEKQKKARFRWKMALPKRARTTNIVSASASDVSDNTASAWSSYSEGTGGHSYYSEGTGGSFYSEGTGGSYYSDGSVAVNPDAIKAAYDKLDYKQRHIFIQQMVNEVSGLTLNKEKGSYDDYDKNLIDTDSASIDSTHTWDSSKPKHIKPILGKFARALSDKYRKASTSPTFGAKKQEKVNFSKLISRIPIKSMVGPPAMPGLLAVTNGRVKNSSGMEG